MNSTMFLNDLSVVDHAYITEHGAVRGGSFNPSFLVSGEIDPVEQVVVDFSTIKKQLKAAIDDKSVGFDHKLWVIKGFSSCDIIVDGVTVSDFEVLADHSVYGELTPITIKTPTTELTVPKNAIKFVVPATPNHSAYTIGNVGLWFAEFLNKWFNGSVEVECFNNINAHTLHPQSTNPIGYFTYAHGLKDSTSWGCQNIAHGHLSFIQFDTTAPIEIQQELLNLICADLDGTVFINHDNVVAVDDNTVEIQYTTPRGTFKGKYPLEDWNLCDTVIQSSPMKSIILETETTIEFLVEYINASYGDLLQKHQISRIFVSEGLSKGAVA